MTTQRIILAGGSGFLGGELAKHFSALGWEVVILTRSPKSRTDGVREVAWDTKSLGTWKSELESATAVVNLTGVRWIVVTLPKTGARSWIHA